MPNLVQNPKYNPALGATPENQPYIFENPQEVINPITGQTAISAQQVIPAAPIQLPTQTVDNSHIGIVEGGQAQIDFINAQMATRAAEVKAEAETRAKAEPDILTKFLQESQAPESMAKTYESIYGVGPTQAEISAKEQGVITQNAAVKSAQNELSVINAQLRGIIAKYQAQNLQYEKQISGGGALTAGSAEVLSRQQTESNRQAAIESLPLQGLTLVAQAKIVSAQGDATTAQNLLDSAQKKFDKVFDLRIADATNQYNYRKDLIDKVFSYATQKEKDQLTQQKEEADRKYQEQKDNLSIAQDWATKAMQAGNSNIAAKITQLNPQSETFLQDLGKLTEQIQVQPKLNTQVVKLDNGATVLLNTDTGEVIKNLGGIAPIITPNPTPTPTPGINQPVPAIGLNGKPLTDTQTTALGYAQRMNDADSIIKELGGQFTGWKSYIGRIIPNIFKSEDRQKFEQAQRNFINAVLRKESGAAISPSEFDSAAKQYFPQPGDSQAVLEQKSSNRQRAINNFLQSANVSSDVLGGSSQGGDYDSYLKAIQ